MAAAFLGAAFLAGVFFTAFLAGVAFLAGLGAAFLVGVFFVAGAMVAVWRAVVSWGAGAWGEVLGLEGCVRMLVKRIDCYECMKATFGGK